MFNTVTIAGRLTAVPELRYTNSQKPVCSFTIANEDDYKRNGTEKHVSFFDCVVWDKTAEFVNKYFTKGSAILVDGKLQSRNWKDNNGNNRVNVEIVADRCYFMESKRPEASTPVDIQTPPTFEELDESDGQLPF